MKEVILTPDGYKKLQAEIEYLANAKRREIADRIRDAREFGDIAENAEYDSAKNEQAHLEARIAMLEERLKSARVVTKKEIKSGEVSVGTKVRLRDRREQALERVPRRQGNHGPQEGRDGRGLRSSRHLEVQDHGYQGGIKRPRCSSASATRPARSSS